MVNDKRNDIFYFLQEIVEGMQKIGHVVNESAPTSFAAVTAINRDKGTIFGSCDKKRPGQVDGY